LLLVELGLDVPDGALRERVTQALPALRDAYVRSLLVYAATAVRPGASLMSMTSPIGCRPSPITSSGAKARAS